MCSGIQSQSPAPPYPGTRQKYREAALLQQVTTDPHTAGFLRPNVVRNLDAWYEAFGVKPGQALYLTPEERIKVW